MNGVSKRAKEQLQRSPWAKQAGRKIERCEQMDEQVAQYISLYSWLFWTAVDRPKDEKIFFWLGGSPRIS